MVYVLWSGMFSVKVPYIDAQHKKLLEITNGFHEALKENRGKKVIFEILNNLIRYTEKHFQDEEEIMDLAGYPVENIENHKIKHEELVDDIFELQSALEESDKHLLYDTESFLNNWLIKHILTIDKDYEPHCGSLNSYRTHRGQKPWPVIGE